MQYRPVALVVCALSGAAVFAQNSERAAKLVVKAPAVASVSQSVPVDVTLTDFNNHAAAAAAEMLVDVTMTAPSGKSSLAVATIRKGQSAARVQLTAPAAGVNRLSAHDEKRQVLDGNGTLLVREPKSAIAFPHGDFAQPLLLLAAYHPELAAASPVTAVASASAATLNLAVTPCRETGCLADGKDSANAAVYYVSDDGSPAPTDIRVYLNTAGVSLSPNPLVIDKGAYSAEASVTSGAPAAATVSFVDSSPAYDLTGPASFPIQFVTAIYGLVVDTPLNVPLVSNAQLVVRFVGAGGVSLASGTPRTVRFDTVSGNIRLSPGSVVVGQSDIEASATVSPTFLGDSDVQISTAGYPTQLAHVHVEYAAILVMLLVGGAVGSVCGFLQKRGSFYKRMFTGLVGAGLLVWLYAFLGLPFLDLSVAHSPLSVPFLALIGGYGGIHFLDWLYQRVVKT